MSGSHLQLNGNNGSNGGVKKTPQPLGNATGPVVNGTAGTQPSQASSPPVNNAPKFGTLVPNRVFVGGIPPSTTEIELAQLFSAYGTVKATKIISDRAGVSKGYGFITFESEEEARRLQREADNIVLRERRLNIAPAIKKQAFNRSFELASPPPTAANQAPFYYASAAGGVPYAAAAAAAAAYQNGLAYYGQPQTTCANGDPNTGQPVYQAPPVYATSAAVPPTAAPYPMHMYQPQPLFVHQQYPYQPIPFDPQFGGPSAPPYLYNTPALPANGNGGPVSGQALTPNVANDGSGRQFNHHGGNQGQHQPPHPFAGAANGNPSAGYYQPFAYNAPEGVYYNMPLYPIDPNVGMYSDGLENTVTGITEVSQSGIDQYNPPAILNATPRHMPPTTSSQPPTSTGTLPKHQPPYLLYECNGYTAPKDQTQRPVPDSTPVVSLLSVGQANERDYYSMQGGRKPKPTQNGGIQPFRIAQYSYQSVTTGFKPYRKCDSSQCRTWSKRRRNFSSNMSDASSTSNPRNMADASPLSSLRTSSNSSANAAYDENLNEQRDKSPPPSSYSPMAYNCFQAQAPVSGVYYNQGMRRNNRKGHVRRNGGPHAQQHQQQQGHEFGAGDAPPLRSDVDDICKKIDGINL